MYESGGVEIYHIGNDEEVSIAHLVSLICNRCVTIYSRLDTFGQYFTMSNVGK